MSVAEPAPCPFDEDIVFLKVEDIVPRRELGGAVRGTSKYRTILASLRELGFFAPLAVYRREDGKYDLLNGHIRLIAARELGIAEIPCLVSRDDEAYTYNAKVNRVVPVQANRMIVKAIEKGVRPERLARTLGVTLETVTRLMNLMEGICPEAVEILKDKPVAEGVFRELRKVKPLRVDGGLRPPHSWRFPSTHPGGLLRRTLAR
ncbi:MAG TPA: ParB/RepB/Spo0J family partition protein [Spirochaetia bacterium]